MVKKTEPSSTQLTVFPGVTEITPDFDLRAARREALEKGGLLTPRQKYKSDEEKKAARKKRSKERREERKQFLADQGLYTPRPAKLTKEQKKARSKTRRRAFNRFLAGNPKVARELGIDPTRKRVV